MTVRLHCCRHVCVSCGLLPVYNAVHFPAGIVPVTTVREDEQVYTCPAAQKDIFAKKAVQQCHDSAGLPVGVQVRD